MGSNFSLSGIKSDCNQSSARLGPATAGQQLRLHTLLFPQEQRIFGKQTDCNQSSEVTNYP